MNFVFIKQEGVSWSWVLEDTVLAQFCVSPKTSDQKQSIMETDSTRWSVNIKTSPLYFLSCLAVFAYILNFKIKTKLKVKSAYFLILHTFI